MQVNLKGQTADWLSFWLLKPIVGEETTNQKDKIKTKITKNEIKPKKKKKKEKEGAGQNSGAGLSGSVVIGSFCVLISTIYKPWNLFFFLALINFNFR